MFRALPNRSDEGLTLEMLAFKLYGGQFALLTVNITKLPCYTLPLTQHYSFFRN